MASKDFKGLTRRTASDKILCDKAFNIAENPKYDGYQKDFASIIHIFFNKKLLLLLKIKLLLVLLKIEICQTNVLYT